MLLFKGICDQSANALAFIEGLFQISAFFTPLVFQQMAL